MIKLTLVQYIRQFSFQRSVKEYNRFFFAGAGIVLLGTLVTFIALYMFTFLNHERHHDSAWGILADLVERDRDTFLGPQMGMVLNFMVMVMVAVKLNKTGQLSQGLMTPRLVESFAFGILIVLGTVMFLGQGISWLAPHDFIGGYRGNFVANWVDIIISYALPVVGFYLAYIFLLRGLEKETKENFWPSFLQIGFLALVLFSFTNLLFSMGARIVVDPIIYVFGSVNNYVGIVLVFFICLALLVFYLILMSDLLLIIIGKKANAPLVPRTNPDLLDR